MPDDNAALNIQDSAEADTDFESIYDAFVDTERGRWFLVEFARRNRHADTALLLAAIGRIESTLLAERAAREASAAAARESAAPANPSAIKPDAAAESKAGLTAIYRVLHDSAEKLRATIEPLRSVSWSMRQQGDMRSELLDRQAVEISQACALFERLERQFGVRTPIAPAPAPREPQPAADRTDSGIDLALFEAEIAEKHSGVSSAPSGETAPESDKAPQSASLRPMSRLLSLFIDQRPEAEPEQPAPEDATAPDPALLPPLVLPDEREHFSFAKAEPDVPPAGESETDSEPADFLLEPWPRVQSAQAMAQPEPAPRPVETVAMPAAVTPAKEAAAAPAAKTSLWPMPRTPNDPLAPIVALSDEEKIALFS